MTVREEWTPEAELARTMLVVSESVDPNKTLRGSIQVGERQLSMVQLTSLPSLKIEHQRLLMGARKNSDNADLTVTELLGKGGMGLVHLATQNALQREVALKTAQSDAQLTASLALLKEALIMGALEHPNIPPLHWLGVDSEGQPCLVMKRIEGETWRSLLGVSSQSLRKSRGSAPINSATAFAEADFFGHLEILLQVCNALKYAHAKGIFHRDIKPDNVMIGHFGEVYLMDWGIAYHPTLLPESNERIVVGTPVYMAPEMAIGDTPDERTDVYLLGATLFEVLSGTPPHAAAKLSDIFLSVLGKQTPVLSADFPNELRDLCLAAMAPQRSQRLPNIAAFEQRVRTYLKGHSSRKLVAEDVFLVVARWRWRNTYNKSLFFRHWFLCIGVMSFGVLIHRAAAIVTKPGQITTLAGDLCIGMVGLGVLPIVKYRQLLPISGVFPFGALLLVFFPASASLITNSTIATACLLFFLLFSRMRKQKNLEDTL